MSECTLSTQELDEILAIQFAVAWAGEGGEEPRLNWWNTEVMSEFGGYDNLRELAANSAQWLGFKVIREAARRTDESLRLRASEPDKIATLYRLGFVLDEQLDHRLSELIHSKASLSKVLGVVKWLVDPVHQPWQRDEFAAWLGELREQKVETNQESIGRRIRGAVPECVVVRVRCLASALLPISDSYPFPHYRLS